MRRQSDRRSDSPATLDVAPSPDIAALEAAAESLTRFGDVRNAIALWSIALRLRQDIRYVTDEIGGDS